MLVDELSCTLSGLTQEGAKRPSTLVRLFGSEFLHCHILIIDSGFRKSLFYLYLRLTCPPRTAAENLRFRPRGERSVVLASSQCLHRRTSQLFTAVGARGQSLVCVLPLFIHYTLFKLDIQACGNRCSLSPSWRCGEQSHARRIHYTTHDTLVRRVSLCRRAQSTPGCLVCLL